MKNVIFQFHKGSIRIDVRRSLRGKYADFNSIKVQLEYAINQLYLLMC